MRRSLGLPLFMWMIFLHPVRSFSESETRRSATELSPCATRCWAESVTINHCAISDVACQCNKPEINTLISDCVVQNCTLSDAFDLAHAWAKRCDRPHNNQHSAMRAAAVGSGVAAFLMVGCRIVARACTIRKFWWDDWCHITAGVFSIPLVTFSNLCVTDGMGYHFYDFPLNALEQVRDVFTWYYLAQVFYVLVIYFIKMSILWLYIRIFPEINYHRYFIATMVFVTLAVIILLPMVIWQCVPIDAIWNLRRNQARCLSLPAVAYASAAVNIATEVAILVLPLPLLQRLRVSVSTKIAMYALFGVGVLVIAIASARVPSLARVEAVQDPTYLSRSVFYWTCAETSAAHLCATALTVRPLYLKLREQIRRKRGGATDTSGTHPPRSGSTSKPGVESRSGSGCQQKVECASSWPRDPYNPIAMSSPSLLSRKFSELGSIDCV